jgi:transcriptional regulator GlxA family with amidase domain
MHTDAPARYTNEELSRLCALSKDHFLKLFKRAMCATPHQYYTSLVVNKGRYLLENTSYSVGEIAVLCGIEDSLYFSRVFKKEMGIAPREYMKNRKPLP